jgi:hypothetical protein
MAALNFPDPNVQTSYTNPDTGITYEWANGIWKSVRTAQTAPELFVDAAGDNLTGNLTLGTDKIVLNATTGAATFSSTVDATAFTINGIPIGGSSSQTIISDTMPTVSNYNAGTLWWNSDDSDTSLYVLYQDPTGPNGDAGGKYWIEASPAPDSIGFDGTHTGDSTFTGNMNVTGSATFASGDIKLTADGDITFTPPAAAAGIQSRLIWTSEAPFLDEVASIEVTRVSDANAASSLKFNVGGGTAGALKQALSINDDGSSTFGGQITLGDTNGDYILLDPDGTSWTAGNFNIGGTIASPSAMLFANGNATFAGTGKFANTVTSGSEDYTGPYTYISSGGMGVMANSSTPMASVSADGSATFAGAIKTTATNNAFYASAGYSGGEAAIRVENTNAGGDPYYLYCDSSDGKIAYIRTDGSATFAGTVNTGSWPNDASTSIGGGAYLARQDSSTSVVWKALSGGIGSSNVTSQILAAGNATFGHSSEQQVNLRPGQVGNGDAIWLQNSDNSRPFLVTAEGGAQFGPLNISSSTGYGAQVDMAANAATVKAQCQQTASQYTLLFAGYMGTNRNFHVSADGSASFAGDVYVENTPSPTIRIIGTGQGTALFGQGWHRAPGGNTGAVIAADNGPIVFRRNVAWTGDPGDTTQGTTAMFIHQDTGNVYIGGDIDTDVTNRNIELKSDGSAEFAGKVTADQVETAGTVFCGKGLGPNSGAALSVENSTGPVTELFPNGSASFAGTRINLNADGSIDSYRSSGGASSDLQAWQSDIGGTKLVKARIKADGSATFTGTVTENASDRKFKENIVDAPAQLADVSALQLRTWDWNDLASGNEDRNDRRSMGLVAQEAELIDSNLVYAVNEGEDTYKAVDYKVLTMKLLGAVKELAAEVAALKAN